MIRDWRPLAALGCSVLALALGGAGCGSKPTELPDRAQRLPRGYVYYLDGAGGGKALRNWGEGVKEGMLAAGYKGAGELFSWETGWGLIADQDASVKYKRQKADEVAKHIQNYRQHYPDAPIGVIGFSAGAAVAVFALEALPEDCLVDNVVLLGASISDDYNLAQALRHVSGHLYLDTSTLDGMLGFLMPMTGTADRVHGEPAAGAKGFKMPADATDETRKLYADKVVTMIWTKRWENDGDSGHHFDNVKKAFIRDHVAPLLMQPGLSPAVGSAAEPANAKSP